MENIKVVPLIKDGKFINLEILYGDKYQYRIYFKDSLLLLPVALAKLAKQFGVEQQKLAFDHTQMNQNNLLEFKDKVVEYCIADCVALYQVLNKFNEQVYELYKINISDVSTLPSLAFRIYRTHFMPKAKIPVIMNRLFDDLSKAYYGGHVDMYIPELPKGKKIYHYDINSLYPYVMQLCKYPTKLIGYFIGDINNLLEYEKINPMKFDKFAGIFKVKVSAPNILHPLLPYKLNNTTVYGQGNWTGWYYTSEILNAMKFGYNFDILAGYIFETTDIFSEYVNKMYQLKAESTKDSPNYLISKLLMNSLYGRFGMSPVKTSHHILNSKYLDEIIQEKGIENVNEIIDLNSKTMLTINEKFTSDANINIAIALAVTANARVAMSQFKNNPKLTGKLYYTDTDSAFIEKALPKGFISDSIIGKMKLEHILTEFVSLGPKVYGGKTVDGYSFTKVKGFKENVSLELLRLLLFENYFKDKSQLTQTKWFRNISKAMISIKSSNYELKPTSNKRELVYSNGKLIGSTNIIIK
jgi:hypothetical protein